MLPGTAENSGDDSYAVGCGSLIIYFAGRESKPISCDRPSDVGAHELGETPERRRKLDQPDACSVVWHWPNYHRGKRSHIGYESTPLKGVLYSNEEEQTHA